jgi:heme-degrading monooxygenase HmoA
MPFSVFYSVRGTKDEIPDVIVEVQRLGLAALQGQPGFREARLMVAEDGTEAVFVTDWDSRDDFITYRRTALGQRIVEGVIHLHPRLSFYDHVAFYEANTD